MTKELRRKWNQASVTIKMVCGLSCAVAITAVLTAFAVDTDSDSMDDAYETHFSVNYTTPTGEPALDYTNAADAALNYDSDSLVNSNEYAVNTDPFAADTDHDGFSDGSDDNPLSRAWIDWGEEFWLLSLTNDSYDVSYAQPAWLLEAFKIDGTWQTNPTAFHVASGVSDDVGAIVLKIDRSILTDNAVLALDLEDNAGAALYVDLYDTNGTLVAGNILGNILSGTGSRVTLKLDIPLETYADAAMIAVARGTGEVTVYSSSMYVDVDGDGLDSDQENQLGTSDSDADSNDDGINDYQAWLIAQQAAMGGYDAGADADFYNFTVNLSSLPDLDSYVPELSRVDSTINYPRGIGLWPGLPPCMGYTFASRHGGYVYIFTAGSYTFYLESDDGSKMWLNDELIIDNDGTHGMLEKSATRMLTSGFHKIRVDFFQSQQECGLIVKCSGPGMSKRVMPAVMLWHKQGNRNPFIKLNQPESESAYEEGAEMGIDVSVFDPELSDITVEYYSGTSKLGETTAEPHTLTVSNLPAGQHDISAVALDGDGGAATSAVAIVTVYSAVADYMPGINADFYDFTINLPALPDLDGYVPQLSRVDWTINYPSTSGCWPGLPSSMVDTFASRHSGYICIPTAGSYTFYLKSDDGSKMWLNDELIIDNDGVHDVLEKSATRELTCGLQKIRVDFFENGGGAGLVLMCSGPCMEKQIVPLDMLWHKNANRNPFIKLNQPVSGAIYGEGGSIQIDADVFDPESSSITVEYYSGTSKLGETTSEPYMLTVSNVPAGLYDISAVALDGDGGAATSAVASVSVITGSVDYVQGIYADFYDFSYELSSLPELTGMFPDLSRIDAAINYPSTLGTWPGLPTSMKDTFASRHSGLIYIPTAGSYTFYLTSDDGSKMWLNDELIIDNDGLHGMREESATRTLTSGFQKFRVDFFENGGGAGLLLICSGPGMEKQIVPSGMLWKWADTDEDGLPDAWEREYFGDLSQAATDDYDGEGLVNIDEWRCSCDPTDIDTDDDMLTDYEELYTYGTNPTEADTDGDGMPDKWEIDNLLDPTVNDAYSDADGDGLNNYYEYLNGTDPQDTDTDDDGVNDYVELIQAKSDPLSADFDGTVTTVQTISGSATTGSSGNWVKEGSVIFARERSGYVEYEMTVPSNGVYAVMAEVTQHNPLTARNMFDLSLYVDGLYSGRDRVSAPYGSLGYATFFTQYLEAGTHNVRIKWTNLEANTFLQVNSITLQSYGGQDSDYNGVPDWQDNRYEAISAIVEPAPSSYVSPICLEGESAYSGVISIMSNYNPDPGPPAAIPLHQSLSDQWYANVMLSPEFKTVINVEDQEGEITYNVEVDWDEFNIMSTNNTNGITIRNNSALLLNAYPAGATNGDVVIDVYDGGSMLVTNIITDPQNPVEHWFTQSGEYTVVGVYSNLSTLVTQTVPVKAVSGGFPLDNIATVSGVNRSLDCPDMPDEGVVEKDTRLIMTAEELLGGGITLTLRNNYDVVLYMIARLGEDGPILDAASVTPVYGDNGSYWKVVENYADGSRLVKIQLQLGYVPDDLEVKLQVFVSGVTFIDGTLYKTLTASDFNELGVATYYLVQNAGVRTSVCHNTRIYQGSDLLSSN